MEIFAFTANAAYKRTERELRNNLWRDIFLGRPMRNSFGAEAAQEMVDLVTDLKFTALPKVDHFSPAFLFPFTLFASDRFKINEDHGEGYSTVRATLDHPHLYPSVQRLLSLT